MRDATLPNESGAQWLDRPLAAPWQRLAALAAHWEIAAYVALVAIGFLLRIWDVGSRAMHHDESLHAYYAWKLFVGQGYTYDPLMHGPLQFEVAPLFYSLFGDSEFSARLLAVLLGTVLVALPYLLRDHLTRAGALLTSLMLVISPTLVYYSRFIRDDIYLACFSLLLFISIVHYLETRKPRYIYIGALSMALALASMEAAYLTFFIFGTFLLFVALREYLAGQTGQVIAAFRSTSIDTWLTGISVFVVITVVLYSTFFTNPYGIWDSRYSFHGLLDPNRKDILGGLTYWKAQHSVERGGQPWFYYLLVIPLYEQLAVVFGFAGIAYAAIRRSIVGAFLVWWAVLSLVLYSWAGEKMPWLSLHIDLPFILLAGLFLGGVLKKPRRWSLLMVGTIFSGLLALEVHSTFALSFRDAADPTEMLIYVQTSQDVPNVVNEISSISHRVTGSNTLQIGLDNADVGGWPFIWYLRNFPNVTETSTFGGPACGTQYCPVLLMLGPEYDQNSSTLLKHYVAQKYRWNWWFPEEYKTWFPDHIGGVFSGGSVSRTSSSNPVGTGTDWMHLWNWLVYKQPFADRGARTLYMLVRRDLVPGSKYYTSRASASPSSPAFAGSSVPLLPAHFRYAHGGMSTLSGPRGVAFGNGGNVYVADTLNHRVVEFSPAGKVLNSFGSVGTGPGQFSKTDSPQALAVAPNGDVYVTDTWNQRIEVFSAQGRFIRQWGGGPIGSGPSQFYGPRSVALGRTGNVFVADTGNKRIQVFSASGKYLNAWGTSGTGPGQFQEPSSVAVGANGQVYVADFWNGRIQVFTSSGTYVRSWSVSDWSQRSYQEPYLAVDQKSGNVFAADPSAHRILAWTPDGRLLGGFGSSRLTLPIGVSSGPGGELAVVDSTEGKLNVFSVNVGSRSRHHK